MGSQDNSWGWLKRLPVTGSSELSVFCLLISSSFAVMTLPGWRSPAENCSYVDVCMKDLPAHARDASLTACQRQITQLAFCFPFSAKLRLSSHKNITSQAWSQVFGKDTEISVHFFILVLASDVTHCSYPLLPVSTGSIMKRELAPYVLRNSFLFWA